MGNFAFAANGSHRCANGKLSATYGPFGGFLPLTSPNYRCAIDDLATGQAMSEGWTLLVLPAEQAASLDAEVTRIRGETTLSTFHGKEYKRRFRAAYRDLLAALRSALESASSGFAVCTLLDENWKRQYLDFINSVVPGALAKAGVSGDATRALSHLAAPLFTLQRFANDHLPAGGIAAIEIDADAVTRDLLDVRAETAKGQVDAHRLVPPIYEAHRKRVFPAAPSLDARAVSIVEDDASNLIQVADVLGNLASAYIAMRLGRVSNTLKEKAGIVEETLGDLVQDTDFSGVELVGESDMRLKASGAFTLVIAAG